MVSSNDLILFYLGLELQSLSLYIFENLIIHPFNWGNPGNPLKIIIITYLVLDFILKLSNFSASNTFVEKLGTRIPLSN